MTTSINSRRPSVHKCLVTPLFWNGVSSITSLLFIVDRKELHFWNQWSFYVCLYANFQFSWWSRDHFSAPFRGYTLYLPNAWSQQKAHLQSLGCPSVPLVWGKTVSCRLCAGQSKGTLKMGKNAVLDLAPPTLQNSGIFHDSTRPHLHFDGLSPKSRRSVVSI